MFRSLLVLSVFTGVLMVELTFELSDSAKECFHEEIVNETKCTLEFQVITGGNYDVDVTLKDPSGNVIYDEKKKQYDSHTFTASTPGSYEVCYSNEFSSYSHKTIYFDWAVGAEKPLFPNMADKSVALTMMETSAVQVHDSLNVIIDYQTHHRLREARARSIAESLFERVTYWSLGQTVLIVTMGIVQVTVLRNFFAEKRQDI